MSDKICRPDADWRAGLTQLQYHVTRQRGTEQPYTGAYWNCNAPGVYRCVCCGAELFDAADKYDAGCGWPSFARPRQPDAVERHNDPSHGMLRTEIRCRRCDAHLGHVFDDGPQPDGLRYCINSAALQHTKD